jgi:hypothetical protein
MWDVSSPLVHVSYLYFINKINDFFLSGFCMEPQYQNFNLFCGALRNWPTVLIDQMGR